MSEPRGFDMQRGERVLGVLQKFNGEPLHLNDIGGLAGYDMNDQTVRKNVTDAVGALARKPGDTLVTPVLDPDRNRRRGWFVYGFKTPQIIAVPKSPPLITEGRPLTAGVPPTQFKPATPAPIVRQPAEQAHTGPELTVAAGARGVRQRALYSLLKAHPGEVKHFEDWAALTNPRMDDHYVGQTLSHFVNKPGLEVSRPAEAHYGYRVVLGQPAPESALEPEVVAPVAVEEYPPLPEPEVVAPAASFTGVFQQAVATADPAQLRAKLWMEVDGLRVQGKQVVVNLGDPKLFSILDVVPGGDEDA